MDDPRADHRPTTVRIRADRALPLICVICGQTSTRGIMTPFRKSKSATMSILGSISVALGTFLIGMHAILFAAEQREDETHMIRIPVCRQHRWYQLGSLLRTALALILAFAAVVFFGLFVLYLAAQNQKIATTTNAVFCLVVGLLAAGLAAAAIRWNKAMRRPFARSVTNQHIVFENVAPEFVVAVEERGRNEIAHVESFLDDL